MSFEWMDDYVFSWGKISNPDSQQLANSSFGGDGRKEFRVEYAQLELTVNTMKAVLLAAIALLPCLAFAESTTISPEATQELAVMTARLKLSVTQQNKIRPMLAAEFTKRQAVQDNTSLSDKQKRDRIGVIHRATCKQIKAVFTPEQMAKIEHDMNPVFIDGFNRFKNRFVTGKALLFLFARRLECRNHRLLLIASLLCVVLRLLLLLIFRI